MDVLPGDDGQQVLQATAWRDDRFDSKLLINQAAFTQDCRMPDSSANASGMTHDSKRDVLLGESLQRCLGNEMFS